MSNAELSPITVTATINAPIAKVWAHWTEPAHITKWCQASDDWHAPRAENDVRVGGAFTTTMAAKDGSFSFDMTGVYTAVEAPTTLAYAMSDGRKVHISFVGASNQTTVTETFDPESEHPREMQETGWQAILNSFKRYTEASL